MTPSDESKNSAATRRQFLTKAGAAAAVGIVGGVATASGQTPETEPSPAATPESGATPGDFDSYSRWHPSFGGPVGSDQYLGKLVPGRRASGLEPVLCEMTDMTKVPWKMVGGVKEFELRAMAVKEEFLPGYFMNVWGYNGSMPGPMIEAFQGDRVRIIVHNDLPEPTTVHWHGLELPVQYDGVPGLIQPISSARQEFRLRVRPAPDRHVLLPLPHRHAGSLRHGRILHHPPARRLRSAGGPRLRADLPELLHRSQYEHPDSMRMDWNWHTINGRSGPDTTPLVCRQGERVRVRLMDFSPMQHHPIHLHGHTFWLTGTEGGRIPPSAWIPRNVSLIGVAMANDFEFIAFNPGDWIFHCHMVHHMMNHMVRQVGPRIRGSEVDDYLRASNRPVPTDALDNPGFRTPGYPQKMQGMSMSMDMMKKINGKREARGMRKDWMMATKGLMTVMRVLPDDLYDLVMNSDENIAPGAVFDAIVRGDYDKRGQQQQT